jgi:hypothetical protein
MIGALLVFSGFVLVAMLIYGPAVSMNIVFTFAPQFTSVPYYTSSGLPRYEYVWWLLALDYWRFVPVFLGMLIVAVPSSKGDGAAWVLGWRIVLVLSTLLELAKFLVFSWLAAFPTTSNVDNSFNGTTSFNYIFWMIWMYSLGFFLWFAGWSFWGGKSIIQYRALNAKKDE